MPEPTCRRMVQMTTTQWRTLMLMADAEQRTPQQQLAFLLRRWWDADTDVQHWREEMYTHYPAMREPRWWGNDDKETDDA